MSKELKKPMIEDITHIEICWTIFGRSCRGRWRIRRYSSATFSRFTCPNRGAVKKFGATVRRAAADRAGISYCRPDEEKRGFLCSKSAVMYRVECWFHVSLAWPTLVRNCSLTIDSFSISRRLASSLRNDFGDKAVYFDETSALPGTVWPNSIRAAVEGADVLIPVIGPTWLKTHDEKSGRRRIDLPDDWVRLEILSFLSRARANQDLVVLPVVLSGATLDISEYLDDALQGICGYQPVQIQDTGNAADFARLKQRLAQLGFMRVVPPPVNTPILGRVPMQLTKKEEDDFLTEYREWRIVEHEKPGVSDDIVRELYRIYEFPNYDAAWQFMTKVSEEGIQPYNHHPRWQQL
jgi:pterin-4a-carbinolamine dehydratase